ncbi:MAG: flagellin, partial [Oscillospiraceae bacterium]|nr:flagellin [Oscillospiraceae bacterium]
LAISEKMRAQITGLETAQKNAKDGISLVQTAEGALTEVHDMLNRMVELATQSANGTYDNQTDRAQMQKELDQLRSEINRIADSSNFNGIKLLNGDMDGAAKTGELSNIDVTALNDGAQDSKKTQKGQYSIDFKDLNITATSAGAVVISFAGITLGDYTVAAADISTNTPSVTITAGDITWAAGTKSFTVGGSTIKFDVSASDGKVTLTGVENPTEAQASSWAAFTLAVKITNNAGGSINNGFDLALHHDEELQYAAAAKLAQGSFALTAGDIVDGATIKIGDQTYSFKVGKDGKGGSGTVIDLSNYEAGATGIADAAAKALSQQANDKFDITADNDGIVKLTEKAGKVNYKTEWDLAGSAATSDATWKNAAGDSVVQYAAPVAGTGASLTLQIGDTAESFNQLKVDIQDMHCNSLGIDGISIADQANAQAAVDKIKAAINKVSDVRGTLGATQNRLDHTINNLSVMTENIQDAESTIRDVDVAEEMMAYTKNNILIQSAQAMLAQANQVPQGVLQLLQ